MISLWINGLASIRLTGQFQRIPSNPLSDLDPSFQQPESGLPRPPKFGSYIGFFNALGVAAITGFMLFINGSFVLAFVTVLIKTDVPIIGNNKLSQLLLFTIPIFMVIVQWIMIDYVRSRVRLRWRKRSDDSQNIATAER